MIPLLIRWTLACNYQAWGSLDEGERERESVGMYTKQDIISSFPPLPPFVPRQRGIDSY